METTQDGGIVMAKKENMALDEYGHSLLKKQYQSQKKGVDIAEYVSTPVNL